MTYQELAIKIADYGVELKAQQKKLRKTERYTPFRFHEISRLKAKIRLIKALRQECIEEYQLLQTKIDFKEL